VRARTGDDVDAGALGDERGKRLWIHDVAALEAESAERYARKLFSVPGELPGQNAKELVEDWPGKNKLIVRAAPMIESRVWYE
jgi:hypothetical protein